MATYTKKTWQTLNFDRVYQTTHYLLFDHILTSDPSQDSSVLWSGVVEPQQRLKHIDEILAQYIKPWHPDVFEDITEFYMQNTISFFFYYTNDDWVTWDYHTVNMTYDWSYNDVTKYILNKPITSVLSKNQFMLLSFTSPNQAPGNNYKIYGEMADGSTSLLLDQSVSDNNALQIIKYLPDIYELPGWETLSAIQIWDNTSGSQQFKHRYKIIDSCSRYCLYYCNSIGGWDSLLMNSTYTKADNYTRLSYKNDDFYQDEQQFNKIDYNVKISQSWQLNTGLLTEDQSERMRELLTSNTIYLHDMATDIITPVNITDTSLSYKTYKNTNRQFPYYEVNVTASQDKWKLN